VPEFEVTDAFDAGLLGVGGGQQMWWETAGNPNGKPVVILHGGPGAPMTERARRMFDPNRYLIVQFDQRQCGRSTPHASTPIVDLSANTTDHLIGDIERLRDHLGIDRWLVWGASWGTILGLAYAEAHPQRVTEMILVSVVGPSHADVAWITQAMGRVFPEQWARFRDAVPANERDGNLTAAYARLVQNPDPAIHQPAAQAWCAWEDTHVATVPGYQPNLRYQDPQFALCFARLVTHYWSNAHFLADGDLLEHADRIADIPLVMINGQLDISGPLDTAWSLHQALPASELVVIADEGHGGAATTFDTVVATTNRFAH